MSKLHLTMLCLATAGLMLVGCGDSHEKVTGPAMEGGAEQSLVEISSPVRSAKPAGSQDVTVVTAAIGGFYGVSPAVTFVDPLPAGAVIAEIHASFQASNPYSPGYYSENPFFLNGTQIGYIHTEGNFGGWTPREFTYVGHPAGYVSGGTNVLQAHAWWNYVNFSAVTLVITYTLPGPPSSDLRLFATEGAGRSSGSTLYELDPSTGATVRMIGPVGYIVNGMEYDPASGVLYGSTSVTDPNYNGLISIDMNTGAGTPVGVHRWNVSDDCGYSAVTNITMDASGQMYGWLDPCSDDLVRVDKTTGVATIVGESGVGTGRNGLDVDNNGNMYLVEWGQVYQVDLHTGAATYVGNYGRSDIGHHGDFHPVTNAYYALGTSVLGIIDIASMTATSMSTDRDYHVLTFVGEGGAPPPPVDTTPPVITLNGDADLTLECHVGVYTEAGATATDDTDGNLPVSISGSVNTGAEGTYVITYTATDAAGNSSTATRTVQVVDTTAPAITLNGAAALTLECHVGVYTETGASASDLCDGVVEVVVSGSVNTAAEGTYLITYTATDAAGNSSTATRTVQVVDTTAPSLALTLSKTSLWPPNHEMISVGSVSASDLCDPTVALAITVTSNEPENGTGDGDTGPDWQVVDNGDGTATIALRAERKGNGTGRIYTINVTATDEAGNSTAKTGVVTVAHSQSKKK